MKSATQQSCSLLLLTLLFAVFVPAHAEVSITLKSSFMKEYKDRATISADLIDHTKGKPNPESKDGDMHCGRIPLWLVGARGWG
jgi:hypothetical protein